ncbi:MAG: hypothetical protein IJZ74_04935 [Clostridia bacterium]|nr:hypothetical protein [Clostridia bacterium]
MLRDRNQASIISLSNKIEVQFTDCFYEQQLKVMIAYCKELDPTRPVNMYIRYR